MRLFLCAVENGGRNAGSAVCWQDSRDENLYERMWLIVFRISMS